MHLRLPLQSRDRLTTMQRFTSNLLKTFMNLITNSLQKLEVGWSTISKKKI